LSGGLGDVGEKKEPNDDSRPERVFFVLADVVRNLENIMVDQARKSNTRARSAQWQKSCIEVKRGLNERIVFREGKVKHSILTFTPLSSSLCSPTCTNEGEGKTW